MLSIPPEAFRQDGNIPWVEAAGHYAGTIRKIEYKVSPELRWRRTGTCLAVRLIVLRPIPGRVHQSLQKVGRVSISIHSHTRSVIPAFMAGVREVEVLSAFRLSVPCGLMKL